MSLFQRIKAFIQKLDSSRTEQLYLFRGFGNTTTDNNFFGKGLYLTDDLEVARYYGDTLHNYLIIGKIFDTNEEFTTSELKIFLKTLDGILKTNIGNEYLKEFIEYNNGKIPESTNIDYISISLGLENNDKFQDLLKNNDLISNTNNSFANVNTAINMILQKMGYVGLKYSTSEIEELNNYGLGKRNGYLIFDFESIKEM